MKRYRKMAHGFLIAAIAWYVIENMYFGWNRIPESNAEIYADTFVFILLLCWFRCDVIARSIEHATKEIKGKR